MKMYGATFAWKPGIKQVDVEKASEKSVWIRGRRQARFGTYESFFPTFSQAKHFLIEHHQKKCRIASSRLEHATEMLQLAQELTLTA